MSEYGNSIVKQFRKHENINDEYWRSMHVKYDIIHEKDNEGINISLKDIVRKLSVDELNGVSGLLGCNVSEEKEDILKEWSKVSLENRQLLLKLWDFQLRRNKLINKYYEDEFIGEQEGSISSGLGQILQLYLDSPTHLAKIYTRQLWSAKSTGDVYIFILGNRHPLEQ